MARNGSGTYSLVSGNPVTTGSTISSTWANNTLSDIATALTGSIAADGQTPITGNLMMSGYKHTGAGSANASGQYLVYGQSSAALADLTLSGALNVSGTQTNTGALNLSGTTTATGAVNLSGTTTATGAVNVSGTTTVATAGTLNVSGTMAIVDTNLTFVDGGDTTKKVAFDVSGVTTGTTRTATWPDKSGTVAMTSDIAAVIHLRDVQAANTAGGTFTSGAWQTRVLNTEATDTGNNCTLSSNQFTLAAGTYNINARAPAQAVGQHKAKLRNITDGTDTIIGSSCQAPAAVASQTDSIVQGQFTIATSKTFELQHQANTTRSTDGFGLASNFGVSEIYAEVWLEKVA